MRRRRQDQSIELRKLKKEQNLNKKRNINLDESKENLDPLTHKTVNSYIIILQSDYADLVKKMQSSNPDEKFKATQLSRQALSQVESPPIDQFVKLGAVKILVENLDDPQPVLFETAWAITNIASGTSDNTHEVVKHNAIPKLVKLLYHESETVADQCVWALGNISGDCAEFRNLVIDANVVPATINLLKKCYKNVAIVKNIAWMLSNLLRHKAPSPPKKVLIALLPVFRDLLNYRDSPDVMADSAWAISYASDSAHNFIDTIIESGILTQISPLLYSDEPKFVHPSLRIFGNLVIGEDQQTQLVLDYNFLPALKKILEKNSKMTMIKEVCWLLSNVAAGTVQQKQTLIDLDLIRPVFYLMENGEHRVKKETCWCISNLVYNADKNQIAYLLKNGAMRGLSSALKLTDSRIIDLVIDTLQILFDFAKENSCFDEVCDQFEEFKGQDYIEELQTHPEHKVYTKAIEFLGKYFEYDAQDEEISSLTTGESTNPSTMANDDKIQFSVPTLQKEYDF